MELCLRFLPCCTSIVHHLILAFLSCPGHHSGQDSPDMNLSHRLARHSHSCFLAKGGRISSCRGLSTVLTQAAVCTELGKPLVYQDWSIAAPKQNQLKIEVVSAGINFADVLQVQGLYQEKMVPPFVSGMECAGTICCDAYQLCLYAKFCDGGCCC